MVTSLLRSAIQWSMYDPRCECSRPGDGQITLHVQVAGGVGILVRAVPHHGVGARRHVYGVRPNSGGAGVGRRALGVVVPVHRNAGGVGAASCIQAAHGRECHNDRYPRSGSPPSSEDRFFHPCPPYPPTLNSRRRLLPIVVYSLTLRSSGNPAWPLRHRALR
jgi:hypothetical protein